MDSKPVRKQLVCACGKTSKHIKMATFSYDYCETCKIEVKSQTKRFYEASPLDDFDRITWDADKLKDAVALAKTMAQTSGLSLGQSKFGGGLPPVPMPPTVPPTAFGVSANKGEAVTCDTCGTVKGTLVEDLPDITYRSLLKSYYLLTRLCNCIDGDSFKFDITKNNYFYHIKDRGWV